MPRTKEQNEAIRQERRETILRGALEVYADRGYAAAEIGEVAERAGVARGLVYYYFKDKLTLYRELFHYMTERSRMRVESHFRREGRVPQLVMSFISGTYEDMLEHPEEVFFFFRMRHDIRSLFTDEELKDWKWYVDALHPIRDVLERGMREGDIRRMNAGLLTSQFWGAVIHGLVHGRQRLEELKAEGKSKAETASAIRPDLRDAVKVCMDMVVTAQGRAAVKAISDPLEVTDP